VKRLEQGLSDRTDRSHTPDPRRQYIYKTSSRKAVAELEYRDNDAGKGQHWYYVRVEQRDGELAWSSPIWARY